MQASKLQLVKTQINISYPSEPKKSSIAAKNLRTHVRIVFFSLFFFHIMEKRVQTDIVRVFSYLVRS